MQIFSSIKKSFDCIISNPSITLFLVLYLIASSILAAIIMSATTKIIAQILVLCLLALILVFLSGWFKIIKESTEKEKIKDKNFYAIFLEGIGEGIVPVSIGALLYIVFVFVSILVAQVVAYNVFGDINFFMEELNKISTEQYNIAQYINSLDINKQYTLYGWNICIMVSVLIFNFLSMFYFPAILSSNKKIILRPFIAIWDSLKFLFKNFFATVFIGLYLCILNMAIAFLKFLNARFLQNQIVSVILLLIYIYFISYAVMLIFNYYEAKNNSSDRTDSIRENEVSDKVSEEN